MSLVIGLTGGIATGKSAADAYFKKQNIPVIDADEIAHNILNKGKSAWKQVIETFGIEYLNKDQSINRRKLGQLVFSNQAQLAKLNSITHPLIHEEILQQIKDFSQNNDIIIVDIPLLFETNSESICDQTIVITIPRELQIERLMKRNNFTRQEAVKRINSQMPLKEKEAKATYVVSNTGTISELEKNLEKLLLKIKQEV